jgi:methanogenic corrinoid protein MtbC1
MMPEVERVDELGDLIREVSPSIAVQVTEQFLDRHPDWRARYGSKAMPAGVQDAGYHLAFLAGAVESGEHEAFAHYAQWAARVLAARGIATTFLSENLDQLHEALNARLPHDRASVLAPHFQAARLALSKEPDFPEPAALNLTADVFLQAILAGQRHAAVRVAREAVQNGMSLQDLYVDVFQTSMYEVGARWEANRLTVAQEHIATAITQYVMAQIYQPPDEARADKGNILLTGVEGELHTVGAIMVGDLLELSGWRVRFLGSNLPAGTILSAVRESNPTHVAISTTMLFNVSTARQLIQAIREEFNNRITILVGGAAFRTVPDLWRQVAADAFAPDLRGVQTLFAPSS